MIVKNLPVPEIIKQRVSSQSLVLIGLGFLLFFYAIPILLLGWTSVNLSSGDPFVNYRTALEGVYLDAIVRSFYYGLVTTVVSLVLAYAISYYIVFYGERQFLLLGLVILPFWVAYIIRYLGIQLFFSPNGPFVMVFGTDFDILFSSVGVIVGLVSALLPFAILPIYNSLNSIDQDLVNASHVLGAGHLRTLVSVIFPLSLSGVIAGGLIEFILATGSFLAPAILGGPGQTMIANVIAETFSSAFNVELAAAIAVLYTVILTVVLMIFNSVINIGEVLGEL
ncbi:ABC transporter permease [Halomarina halobia]|uniref:ABC transporter permease n=1 Tax=Halomarina halobia TaxID=3033386 RepID=A0ABD6AFG8_9EURY|nr:ABC transporter permease [Halomarina sp. PSR21]